MLPVVSEVLPGLMARFDVSICRLARERVGRLPSNPLKWPNWLLGRVKHRFAQEFGRRLDRAEILHPDAFRGASHAGRIDLRQLTRFLRRTHTGLMEIALHPGERSVDSATADGWDDPLADLRSRELETLTSPAVVSLLERERVHLGRLSNLTAVPAPRLVWAA